MDRRQSRVENRDKVKVVSSIIESSKMVFGEGEAKPRAFPSENGNLVFDGDIEGQNFEEYEKNLDSIDRMRGIWRKGSYSIIEGNTIVKAAVDLMTHNKIISTEYVGKFHEEGTSESTPICSWQPTSGSENTREKTTR